MNSNNISTSPIKQTINNISNENKNTQNKSIDIQNINNLSENQNPINKNNICVYNFINEMPLQNLNDYYDIETSLFLKRIEKLNLKFYWTSECILNQQDIKYPYNKLFLILFKQISLYIEEIARLNKQLKQKIKNEKSYQIKLEKMKQKENEHLLNKQMLINLQRANKLLEKKNEKIKNENEKLNKKLENSIKTMTGNNTCTNALYRNNNKDKKYFYITPKFSDTSMEYGSFITQESIMSKGTKNYDLGDERKNKKLLNSSVHNRKKIKSTSNSLKKKKIKENNKDIINHGINICEEEIENLEIMEEILKSFKNRNMNNLNNLNKSEKNSNFDIASCKTSNSSKINNSNNYIKNNNKKNKLYHYKPSIQMKKSFH